jgi:tetratricopeptide (TPR) repeat protein
MHGRGRPRLHRRAHSGRTGGDARAYIDILLQATNSLGFVDLRAGDDARRTAGETSALRVSINFFIYSTGVTMPRSAVLAFLFFCTLSAHAAEAPWIRVNSTHFSVLTDGGEKRGREVILRFEQMRAVFAQLLMKTRVRMPEPLEIIAVKSDKEYVQLAPFVRNQPISAPAFFLPGEDRNYIVLDLFADDSWRAISHSFAHLLLNYNYPPTPGWFDEGFAEYFSSVRLADKQAQMGSDPELSLAWQEDLIGNQTEVRNPPKSLTGLLSNPVWLTIPDLFAMRHNTSNYQEGSHHTLFYAESWMVMHYLINKNKLSETGTYFGLVQNQKMPVEQAIQQAYGVSASQFEQTLKNYFHSLTPLFQAEDAAARPGTTKPGGEIYQFPVVGPEEVGASVQSVTEADAQALLAEAALRLPEHREQAVKELRSIVSQPKLENAVAHRALAWVDMEKKEFDQATEESDKAGKLNERDPWVHYYKALVKYSQHESTGEPYHGLANMIQDLRAVLDWDPDFAEAYNLLAMARLEGGGIRSAIEAIKAATQLSPRNQTYLLNMARVYMAAKQWDDAAGLLNSLKTSQNPQIAQAAKKNLEDLPTLRKYGVLPRSEATSASRKPAVSATPEPKHKRQETADVREEDTSEHEPSTPAGPQIDKRPVKFLKGKLATVDCTQAPAAVLTVITGRGTLRLRSEDYKSITLIGADDFSCDWRNRAVAVNYKAGGKLDGDVVSLEIQ